MIAELQRIETPARAARVAGDARVRPKPSPGCLRATRPSSIWRNQSKYPNLIYLSQERLRHSQRPRARILTAAIVLVTEEMLCKPQV